jgi:pimeloyl-ACP methyl ester carboxylesterase
MVQGFLAAGDPEGANDIIVLQPGAFVSSLAYYPLAWRIVDASGGAVAVLVATAPLGLAFLGVDAPQKVLERWKGKRVWVGGHSLGGVAAARFARSHTDRVRGLVLLASYPAKSDDLSSSSLPVLSLWAEHDGLSTKAKIEASRPLLPPNASFVMVSGGNHAGFGAYGPQRGDGQATIPRQAQWDIVARAIVAFMSRTTEDAER